MAQDHDHNPDPNLTAARIVAESAGAVEALPADVEAAWQEWSRGIQKVDERGMSLLRAAFEAGYDAAPKETFAAVALGRLGGLKGGIARAEKLSKQERSEIAKKAAAARWKATKEEKNGAG